MIRGDAELASAMRKMCLEEDQLQVDVSWDRHEGQYVLTFRGSCYITEEEAQAIEEAQNGE